MGIGGLYLGIKRSKRETNHSPLFSAETKNVWSYTSTPSDFMGHCFIKHRDHLIFFLTAVEVCGRKRSWPILRPCPCIYLFHREVCSSDRLPFQRLPCRSTSCTSTCNSLSATERPRLLTFQVSIICCPRFETGHPRCVQV